MIVTDIFGKEKNAKYFEVEVIRGHGEGEHGNKVVVLHGISHYFVKLGGLQRTSCMIQRKVITSLDTLDDFLSLRDQLRLKQDIIDKEVDEWMNQESKRTFYDEKSYMVEKGYAIYEKDEAKSYDDIR